MGSIRPVGFAARAVMHAPASAAATGAGRERTRQGALRIGSAPEAAQAAGAGRERTCQGGLRINRVKALVLALFALYWISVVALVLVAAPEAYDRALKPVGGGWPAELGALLALTALFCVLGAGVMRGWRWTFWLILADFLAGILRVPLAALALDGKVSGQGPDWYVAFTAAVGLTQFAIALVMLAGYRKSGPWGEP